MPLSLVLVRFKLARRAMTVTVTVRRRPGDRRDSRADGVKARARLLTSHESQPGTIMIIVLRPQATRRVTASSLSAQARTRRRNLNIISERAPALGTSTCRPRPPSPHWRQATRAATDSEWAAPEGTAAGIIES